MPSHFRDIQVLKKEISDDVMSGYSVETNHKIKNISGNIKAL